MLFNSEHKAGYRLAYVEVYNWGTFDKDIWRLTPNSANSLLTGPNGSGKTTLVHALLTLLVPRSSNFFRHTTDTATKRERDEKSYFFGAYGNIKQNSQTAAQRQELRPKRTSPHSVLLAYFENEQVGKGITIAQVRWCGSTQVKRAYLTANQPLTIKEHFSNLDIRGVWKKKLQQTVQAEFFKSFVHYSQRFSKIFGFRSDKALTLFAKTIGVKVLGNLNSFIRDNMLDPTSVGDEFFKLTESYQTLIACYRNIEKASYQLELLGPIIEQGKNYHVAQAAVENLQDLKLMVPAYFATQKQTLIQEGIVKTNQQLERVQQKLYQTNHSLKQWREQEKELEADKRNQGANEQVRYLDREMTAIDKELQQKKDYAFKYNQLAKHLKYQTDLVEKDELVFYQSLQDAKVAKTQLQQEQKSIDEQWSDVRNELKNLQKAQHTRSADAAYLQQSRSKIPPHVARVRTDIATALNIEEADLPFVGELLQIKEKEKAWEYAIEKLLHGFALTLLVSEEYYHEVNQYVNRNTIRGRLVYFKVNLHNTPKLSSYYGSDSVVGKIAIKPDTPFRYYLSSQLRHSFDYKCITNEREFARCDRAIMQSGLIKAGKRHEKDDRRRRNDNYVLGWNNQGKKQLLATELASIEEQIYVKREEVGEIEQVKRTLKQNSEVLQTFINFDNFAAINWQALQVKKEVLLEQKNRLLSGSNDLAEIEEQLQLVLEQIEQREKEVKRLAKSEANLERDIQDFEAMIVAAKEILSSGIYKHIKIEDYLARLQPYVEGITWTLKTVGKTEQEIAAKIGNLLKKKIEHRSELEKGIMRQMRKFIFPEKEISDKFPNWRAETLNLRDDMGYLSEYENRYQQILQDDLPKYKERFKKTLNDKVIDNIVSFDTFLQKQANYIDEKIVELNTSLKEIDYDTNPTTYIELEKSNQQVDNTIKEFRGILKNIWTVYGQERGEENPTYEATFGQVQLLIERLTEDEKYRKKVTDVRNWYSFAAHERYRSDKVTKRYYEDSAGLSDGQKAKLAYTILVSAIAYQYNIRIHGEPTQSFRFIVVDEAFGKVDPTNAAYAMQLFEKFKLQVMIVTPLDKIHVIEDYIQAVHYVQNKTGKKSEVFNLTMSEYQEKKEDFVEVDKMPSF